MTFAELVYTGIIPFIDGYVIQFLYALAFLFFIIGIVTFFLSGGEENRARGKKFAVWALIGLVVLFSVWSIVRILLTSVFSGSYLNSGGGLPSGSSCTSGTQCQSRVCVIRGLYTSTCE